MLSLVEILPVAIGDEPSISYLSRMQENDNYIGQGVRNNLFIAQLLCSYQIRHNLFIDFELMYRQEDSILDQYDTKTLLLGLGLRWNIGLSSKDW